MASGVALLGEHIQCAITPALVDATVRIDVSLPAVGIPVAVDLIAHILVGDRRVVTLPASTSVVVTTGVGGTVNAGSTVVTDLHHRESSRLFHVLDLVSLWKNFNRLNRKFRNCLFDSLFITEDRSEKRK